MVVDNAVMHTLRMRYSEAHRRYHGWGHVEAMNRLKDWCRPDIFNLQAFELAILFQYAIIEPGERDSADRSVNLMRAMVAKHVAPVTLDEASALIIAGATAIVPLELENPQRADAAVFIDMNLAIFGSAPDVYDAYEGAVREEFADMDDETYRGLRLAILDRLALRPGLYLTQRFHDEFARQAESNLARHRDDLRSFA